jgi:hypothetical protein
VIAGAPGVGGGLGQGEKEEGVESYLFRWVLTLVGDGLWRWFHGKERPAVEVGGGSTNGGGGGAIGRCWGLEDWVGTSEKTSVLFIGSLRRFEGKISPRWWGSPVEAVLECRPDSRPPAR